MAAAALTACASIPAPVQYGPGAARHHAPSGPSWQRPPINPNAPPQVLAGQAPLQCVPFARQESGIDIWGDANTWWEQAAGKYPRSSLPAPGSVLVLRGYRDDTRGHVAVVTEVLSKRMIRVDHANWLNHGEISLNVPILDVSDNNDWSQVKVWNIPTGQWGARTYLSRGFIHPFLLQAAVG
ncbi:MAG: CHAP domain-containing protein [Terricaulis sp.]